MQNGGDLPGKDQDFGGFNDFINNLNGQGEQFNALISPSSQYLAYLSKVDEVGDALYDLYFELVTFEWWLNVVYLNDPNNNLPIPTPPVGVIHITNAPQATVLSTLGLEETDDIAEGSWYRIHLVPADAKVSGLTGQFYDPDVDFKPQEDEKKLLFGEYTMPQAELITLPFLTTKGYEFDDREIRDELVETRSSVRKRFHSESAPPASSDRELKRRRKDPPGGPPPPLPAPPPVPPPPPISSIGMMDVGMGNCALLFDQNQEPVVYFDVGFPLFFYTSSIRDNLRPNRLGYLGPIMQNQTNNLSVVLSHWDWDHWRMGRVANLTNLNWIYPQQANIGPSATAFINTLVAQGTATPYPVGTPAMAFNGYTIYQCTLPAGGSPAMIKNNTGLAMTVDLCLPIADANHHQFVLTGDCNFNHTGIGPGNISGLLAVHHGSNNHGAAQNLPTPVAPYQHSGRVVYSYGITGGGNHCYGFPVPAAINSYQAAGWGHAPPPPTEEQSTAEGSQINQAPPPPYAARRGNIKVGDQTGLNAHDYGNTAFFHFPNSLT